VCSTAVVAAGASFFATPALAAPVHAKSTLALTGSTTVNALNLGSTFTARTSGTTTCTISGQAHPAAYTALLDCTDIGLTAGDVGRTVTYTAVPGATTITAVNGSGQATLSNVTAAFTNGVVGTAVTIGAGTKLFTTLIAASYATRVTSAVSSNVYLKVLSQPTSAKLYANATGTTTTSPVVTDTWTALSTGGTTQLSASGNGRVFVSPDTAGTYTYEFYEDVDGSGTLTAGDNESSIVTLYSKAPNATAGATTWTPTVTAPTTLAQGVKVPVTVDYSDLTLTDARGATALGTGVAALTKIGFSGTGGAGAGGAATFGGTGGYRLTGTTTNTTALATAITFDTLGDGLGASSSTDVSVGSASTTVSAASAATAIASLVQSDVAASVGTFSGATVVKGGTADAVTFNATATTAAAGDLVYFTLTPGLGTSTSTITCSTTYPTLTADGTLVATYGNGVKLYAAAANSATVAALAVHTSDTTGNCGTYTIDAWSNGNNIAARTVSYVVPTPSAFSITNATADLLPPVGTTSVTLKGSLTDQFSIAVAPLTSDTQEATVTVGTVTGHPAWDGTAFSYTYTPTTAPTSPTTTAVNWSYTGATACTSACTKAGTITWTSTSAANAVTLSTPVDAATGINLSSSGTVNPGQSGNGFGDSNGQVTGTVTDSTGAAMPYKKVTLSGDDGVYFSTASDGTKALTKTIDVVTNASGQFTGAYAFFTKAGDAVKVTATADAKSDISTVDTDDSTDGYIVSVNDTFGTPGAISVTGKVVDIFGNPVPSRKVDLTVTPTGSGTLGAAFATTTTDGTFTGTYTANAGAKGDFTVTAIMENFAGSAALTANPVPTTTWATTAAITGLPDGQYKDTSKVTVGPIILSGPSSRQGAGFVRLIGVANPNTVVTIKGRTAGSTAGLVDVDTVTADANGDFQANEYITDTTTFVAVSGSQYSQSLVVAVTAPTTGGGGGGGGHGWGVAKISNLVPRALGKGKVSLTVVGNGNGSTTVIVFQKSGKKWLKVSTVMARSNGVQVIVIKTGKGAKTFRVAYWIPGKTIVYKNVTIRVK
jgi:hypothetical protein